MPDKRDMRKAKSHRNAKTKQPEQSHTATPRAVDGQTTVAALSDPAPSTQTAKQNKSRR